MKYAVGQSNTSQDNAAALIVTPEFQLSNAAPNCHGCLFGLLGTARPGRAFQDLLFSDVSVVEPDPRMARVAADNGIPLEQATFEDWRRRGRLGIPALAAGLTT